MKRIKFLLILDCYILNDKIKYNSDDNGLIQFFEKMEDSLSFIFRALDMNKCRV